MANLKIGDDVYVDGETGLFSITGMWGTGKFVVVNGNTSLIRLPMELTPVNEDSDSDDWDSEEESWDNEDVVNVYQDETGDCFDSNDNFMFYENDFQDGE
jgi:hypothetical protein